MRKSQLQLSVKIGNCPDYSLIDSGNGLKLEKFSGITIIRPEPKAWWKKSLNEYEWNNVDAVFDSKTSSWQIKRNINRTRQISLDEINFELRLNDNSKHVGIFPEQEPHWNFIKQQNGQGKNLLNLFGYTGAATLFALKAGFSVTHVDASSPSVAWAKKNLEISGMKNKPVRWIVDDTIKFVNREIRRGKRYHAIILDPPAFGRGPKGELWKLESSLYELLYSCSKLLDDNPLFIILTIYNIEASPLMSANILYDIFGKKLKIESGELALPESSSGRLLSMSLYNLCEF